MPGVDSLDVRVFWSGAHAAIPANWDRDTAFDERFLQGDDSGFTGAANAGGSHTHTNSHTHTGNQHRHTFTGANTVTTTNNVLAGGSAPPFLVNPDTFQVHSHNSWNTAYGTITYQNKEVTIDGTDALPPYKKLIVIKPDAVTDDIPDDAVCFTDESAPLPTGFVKYATIDDHFIQGPSTGADADLTSRGGATHGHNAQDHDHDIDNHTHPATTSGLSNPQARGAVGTDVVVYRSVHHNVGFGLKVLSDLTDASLTVVDATWGPAYTKLLGVQNTSGAATTPIGVIVAFVGAYAGIPSNWQLCDGNGDTVDCTNTQIKATGTDGDIGNQDGSINTHTHTITGTHGHTHGTHNHNVGSVGLINTRTDRVADFPTQRGIPFIGGIHTHTWTINVTTPTLQNASVTLDDADGRSAYRTVVWIKKMIERPGVRGLLGATF